MARLKHNGIEVARFVRSRERNDLNVLRDRTYVSVRSNGKVLRKHIAVVVDVYNGKGFRSVTRGWKVWDIERVTVDNLAKFAVMLATAGFTVPGELDKPAAPSA
jgi:hypothetical protein